MRVNVVHLKLLIASLVCGLGNVRLESLVKVGSAHNCVYDCDDNQKNGNDR